MRGTLIIQLMVLVHTVDDRGIAINMEQVVSISSPGDHVTDKANCLISFGTGRFVNTKETCSEVTVLWQREDAKAK